MMIINVHKLYISPPNNLVNVLEFKFCHTCFSSLKIFLSLSLFLFYQYLKMTTFNCILNHWLINWIIWDWGGLDLTTQLTLLNLLKQFLCDIILLFSFLDWIICILHISTSLIHAADSSHSSPTVWYINWCRDDWYTEIYQWKYFSGIW